jgi:NitT/TauT family transport system permease protein
MRQGTEQLPIGIARVAGPLTGIEPAQARSWQRSARLRAVVPGAALPVLWGCLSVGLFAGIWEACWVLGWADPRLLPPPHIFLGDIADQAKFFNTVSRWQVGVGQDAGPSPAMAVVYTVLATTTRVFAGLAIAASLAISTGVAIRYFTLFERLTLPTVTLLAPVSPIAWLPVAIFLFGIGNKPAIFMVVIALLFHMILATISQIDGVNRNFINVARTMGATKRQIYARVIIPAILPQLFVFLRFNLFGAWMVVLVAEATGVGYGLGQVIMLGRNTFNPSLVFFTIVLIGALGFSCDWLMRLMQKKLLYWAPDGAEILRGL